MKLVNGPILIRLERMVATCRSPRNIDAEALRSALRQADI